MKVYALICAHKSKPQDANLCYLDVETVAVTSNKDLLEERRKYLRAGNENYRYTIVTLPWETE